NLIFFSSRRRHTRFSRGWCSDVSSSDLEPPHATDELGTLTGFLEFLRATLAWKTDGLDEAGLRATLPPSDMTLGGMLHHLAFVRSEERRVGEDRRLRW